MGTPISFSDNTAPHLSAVYSWRLTATNWREGGGVYTLLHQDNIYHVGCYWSTGQSLPSNEQLSNNWALRQQGSNCTAQDRNFLGGGLSVNILHIHMETTAYCGLL